MKRLLLLLSLTTLALSLAGPAVASAYVWKDGGKNVTGYFELPMTGGEIIYPFSPGGLNCSVDANLSSEGGSTAKITKWTQSKCDTWGTFAACTVTSTESKALPWPVTLNAWWMNVSAGSIRIKLSSLKPGTCPASDFSISVAGMKLTPNSTLSITDFEFEALPNIGGNLLITGPNYGTYGIG